MILELGVLFGVEHFEQRRGRIAAEVLTQLVDLVEQEQRVRRAGLLEVGNDLARHRTDIGAPVAADFRLVAHAAQRLAHELAPARLGDRLAERGLAHTRRADEAQDRPLQLVGARLHRQIFDDPVLDLFERIVIGIEHALRGGDVLLELGLLAPRQAKQHVEIVADHRRLGAHRLHAAQLLELAQRFRLGFDRQLGLFDLLGQFGDFVGFAIIAAAQFGLNRLQLFVEVIFALGFFHLALHAATDFLFDLQYAQFAFHQGKGHFEPLERIGFNKKRLLVRNLEIDVRRNRIGQLGRIVNFGKLDSGFSGYLLVQLRIILELLDNRTHQSGRFRPVNRVVANHFNFGLDIICRTLMQAQQICTLLALNQHTNCAIGQFQQLHHRGRHADGVKIIITGIVFGRV